MTPKALTAGTAGKNLPTIVVDHSTTSTVDALRLARGWLAVSSVSGKDDNRPALDHTVCIEQYDEGLRLIATDSSRLLLAWVCAEGFGPDEEPTAAELPHATAVAVDQWGRGRSLLSYLAQQAAKEENDGLTALVRLGVPWQAPETPKAELQFDGFAALAVDLEYPGHERLQLPVFEGNFPNWRHVLSPWKPRPTSALAVSQESAAVLAKATKWFGEDARIELRFGGKNKPVAVAFGTEPRVYGLVMPTRWNIETNAPEGDE